MSNWSNFVTTNSAEAQPIAATRYFKSVLPQIRVMTKCKPTKSRRSTVFLRNSFKTKEKHLKIEFWSKRIETVLTTNDDDSSTGGKHVAIVNILKNWTKRYDAAAWTHFQKALYSALKEKFDDRKRKTNVWFSLTILNIYKWEEQVHRPKLNNCRNETMASRRARFILSFFFLVESCEDDWFNHRLSRIDCRCSSFYYRLSQCFNCSTTSTNFSADFNENRHRTEWRSTNPKWRQIESI